jgi:hypothetical protein
MNDTAMPPAPRVPLTQLRQTGTDHITALLHRALPAKQKPVSGGFNSSI